MKIIQFRSVCAILPLLLSFAGCRSGVRATLDDVRGYIGERPDSALPVLAAIDTSSLRTCREKAEYSLLYSMALDKSHIDTSDARIIQPAVDYYVRGKKSNEESMLSLFYLARVQHNGKLFGKAAVTYTRAAEQAEKIGDYRYEGMAYGSIAEAYGATYNYDEAIKNADKAMACFRKDKDDAHIDDVLFRKAQYLANGQRWAAADSAYRSLLAEKTVDRMLQFRVEASFAYYSVMKPVPDINGAFIMFSDVLNRHKSLFSLSQYGAYAYTLAASGRFEEAESIVSEIESQETDSSLALYWLSKIKSARGDYYGAYTSLDKYLVSEEPFINIISHPVSSEQRDYYRAIGLEIRDKAKVQTLSTVIIALVVLLCTMLVFVILRSRILRLKEEKENIVEKSRDFEQRFKAADGRAKKSEEKTSLLKDAYLLSFREQFHLVSEMSESLRFGRRESSAQLYSKVKAIMDDINSDAAGQRKFEKTIDHYLDNVMAHFREDYPRLKEDDYKFFSCIIAGFDGPSLLYLFNMTSKAAVHTRKSRLKKMIHSSNVVRKDSYLSLFV